MNLPVFFLPALRGSLRMTRDALMQAQSPAE